LFEDQVIEWGSSNGYNQQHLLSVLTFQF
jgi:hypothetical protein